MNPKDWPALPDEELPVNRYLRNRNLALETRLRDTAAVLRKLINRQGQSHDDYCSFMQASAYRRSWHGNPYCDCTTSALLDDARALLMQLRTEELI